VAIKRAALFMWLRGTGRRAKDPPTAPGTDIPPTLNRLLWTTAVWRAPHALPRALLRPRATGSGRRRVRGNPTCTCLRLLHACLPPPASGCRIFKQAWRLRRAVVRAMPFTYLSGLLPVGLGVNHRGATAWAMLAGDMGIGADIGQWGIGMLAAK